MYPVGEPQEEMMGQLGLSGLCILGSRYNGGVRGWGLRSKEMSVLDRPWRGLAVE